MKQNVAIIGGGIAGLTAAYLLRETCEITLYERDGRLGGNAYTHQSPEGDDIDISVFSFSRHSYVNFFKLLDELGVETRRFSLRGLGSTSYNLDTHQSNTFAPLRLRGLLPSHFREAKSMALGMRNGVQLLDAGRLDGLSMREAFGLIPELRGHAYLHFAFMLCLTSSMSCEQFMAAPAPFFFGKVKRHFTQGPGVWRLVKRRTRTYVDAMADHFRDRICLKTQVTKVARGDGGVRLQIDGGAEVRFDKVILACPADQALGMLEEPTADERRLLGAWSYNDGLVVVHRDDSHFPPESERNLYCYLYTDRDGRLETSINACYGRQKGVSKTSPWLGTQHPNFPIRDELVGLEKVFRTPIFDPGSVATIAELPTLNGQRHTYYCGSHFGVGLHEDAVTSAANVARSLGASWA